MNDERKGAPVRAARSDSLFRCWRVAGHLGTGPGSRWVGIARAAGYYVSEQSGVREHSRCFRV